MNLATYCVLIISNFYCAWTYPKLKIATEKAAYKRIRREDIIDTSAISYESPYGHHPLPAYRPERIDPVFPMVHSFNNGFNYQDNSNSAMFGHLKVPIVNWGIWDLHADFSPQTGNPELQFGYLLSPTNTLNMSPDEIYTLSHDPNFKKRRKAASAESVNDLPGSGTYLGYGGKPYSPLICKPPLCNPHVHTFALGAQYQQGLDYQLPGTLDFPIPADNPLKPSQRFKLFSDSIFGVQPVAFNYGHNINGINPWTTAFKPTTNSGNPVAMAALSNPAKINSMPYVAPPLDGHNIFEDD